MFTKTYLTLLAFFALTLSHVSAHAVVSPALGVTGAPIRADAQRPKKSSPCGKVDIASNIDTSEALMANADGTFTTQIQNFNRLLDGSRFVQGTVDASGTGNSFAGEVTMTQNGQKAPFQLGTETISGSLPPGTKCTGGASGNLCLVSFKSVSGFGNCVVIQQPAATTGAAGTQTGGTVTGAGTTTAGAGTNAAGAGTTTTGAGTNAAGAGTTTTSAGTTAAGAGTEITGAGTQAAGTTTNQTGNTPSNQQTTGSNGNRAQGGTRAARAALFTGKEAMKRNVWNWVWA